MQGDGDEIVSCQGREILRWRERCRALSPEPATTQHDEAQPESEAECSNVVAGKEHEGVSALESLI